MDYTGIGITVLWTFLFFYIIVASIDFGAGFLTLHTKLTGEEKKINHLIERYLNPVWEVTNVFFVFFFVGFVGFFPDSALYLGTLDPTLGHPLIGANVKSILAFAKLPNISYHVP